VPVTFGGRVEARLTAPTGGAAVSATVANGGAAVTATLPAASYYATAAGGVSSWVTSLQTALNNVSHGYPRTAAAMANAVGWGTWSTGWLCDETSGNLAPVFGATTMTASSSPTYSNTGYRGGTDLAVGFDSALDAFDGGNTFDIGAGDLCLAWVAKFDATPSAYGTIISKINAAPNAGYAVYVTNVGQLGVLCYDGSGLETKEISSAALCVGEWHVGMAIVDRGAGTMRIATKGLTSGTATTSTTQAVSGNITTAETFRFGQSDWAGINSAFFMLGAAYVGTGGSAAANLSTNLATAVSNFAAAIASSWSVAFSTTTGLISINWTGYATPTWSLSWTSTDLRDVAGYAANITAVTTTQTGTAQAKGVVLMDCPLNLEGDPKRVPRASDSRTSMSPTGETITLVGNTYRRHRGLVWEYVPITQVWAAEATYENGSWEEFFAETQLGLGSDWFTPGSPVQIYYSNAGSDALLGADDAVAGWSIIGVNSIEPKKSVDKWTGLWRIELPLIVAVDP
jgi:hypothetical protein